MTAEDAPQVSWRALLIRLTAAMLEHDLPDLETIQWSARHGHPTMVRIEFTSPSAAASWASYLVQLGAHTWKPQESWTDKQDLYTTTGLELWGWTISLGSYTRGAVPAPLSEEDRAAADRIRAAATDDDPRCKGCGEPLRLIALGAVGHVPGEPCAAIDGHRQASGWVGGPGECGAECSCGTAFDGFDSLGEATACLDRHLAEVQPAAVTA